MMTAADLMTDSPRTSSTFSTVLEAVLIFRDANCRLVPVLEDAKPAGVLTDREVALALVERRLPSDKPVDVFTRAVENVKPIIEVRSKRVGGATYQVPMQVNKVRQ